MPTKAFLAMLAALAGPAFGQIVPTPPAPGKSNVANPLDRIICRTEEGLGSRLNKEKVCRTVREWKEMQDENQRSLQDIQQRESGFDPPSG